MPGRLSRLIPPPPTSIQQCTYALLSEDGLQFNGPENVPPQPLANSYIRPFYAAAQERMYALARKGVFEAPANAMYPWGSDVPNVMTWLPYRNASRQLSNFVEAETNGLARLNRVGIAHLTNTILEVHGEKTGGTDGIDLACGADGNGPPSPLCLLQVVFSCKMFSDTSPEDGGRYSLGYMWRAFLDISSADANDWHYVTDENGALRFWQK